MNKRTQLYISIALGIIVSVYLTYVHFNSSALACPTSGIINCETVLTSQYSSIFGIPVAALGLVLFMLGLLMLLKNNETMIFLWSIAGAGAILYSVASQFLLGEICIWCLALDVIIFSTIIIANKK